MPAMLTAVAITLVKRRHKTAYTEWSVEHALAQLPTTNFNKLGIPQRNTMTILSDGFPSSNLDPGVGLYKLTTDVGNLQSSISQPWKISCEKEALRSIFYFTQK